WHAVEAALANPARGPALRLLATPDRARQLEQRFGRALRPEAADNQQIAQQLPQGAVHQGVALKAPPPEPAAIEDFAAESGAVLLMLDQVTDPQNVGAVLRAAAAFRRNGV